MLRYLHCQYSALLTHCRAELQKRPFLGMWYCAPVVPALDQLMEVGEPEASGHPQLYSKLKTSLVYKRLSKKLKLRLNKTAIL